MRILVALALTLVTSLAFAQSQTPRFGAPYTDHDNINNAFNKFDKAPVGDTVMQATYCSQQANTGTIYMASVVNNMLGIDTYGRAVGDATCDARGNATEATADVVLSPDRPVRVLGMACQVETAEGASQTGTFTARNAAADLSPTLTCQIAGATAIHCAVNVRTVVAPIIPANTPIAVQAVSTNDQSAVGALCKLFFEIL